MKKIFVKEFSWLCIILILIGAQAIYTFNSLSQIRLEELSEGIRNVYYFEHNLVFSGINAHLGWYIVLDWVYKLFGFSMVTVKYFRLVLQSISIICLVLLFRKYFSFKQAAVPLLTIGLSPTLLFFTTLVAHYGIDLQYLPIILYILSLVDIKKTYTCLVLSALLASLAMLVWLSYPTMIVYLPMLFFLYFIKLVKIKLNWSGWVVTTGVFMVAFLLPLIVLVWPIINKDVLLYDQVVGGGIFRGAGEINCCIFKGLPDTLAGLSSLTQSYYYEVSQADFSQLYPWISVVLAFSIDIYFTFKKKIPKVIFFSIFAVLIINSAMIIAAPDLTTPYLSSVRRATGILASIYTFYLLSWLHIFELKSKIIKSLLIVVLLLLPIHHLSVYKANYDNLKTPSSEREQTWFTSESSPQASLDSYLGKLSQHDLKLVGFYTTPKDFGWTYNWIYTSLEGACLWNKLDCYQIYGYDSFKREFVLLNLQNVDYSSKDYQYR